ncbi:amidohydrolase family protein [Isobaculum melis]|uniref:Amidohydrolase-related domain-containing protein n=1 Tax=Isobaculum melis TaxID=142588 RepID=A0A1H9T1Y9_9LACT|nr:amidohydrolase family protein [Isobaculum melis]SER91158.1 hypothetical protein SAMN04488559_11066 [Isobaculum melis]
MKKYDIHSHFGPTSSGESVPVAEMVNELKQYGIEKVGISCLSGNDTQTQNEITYQAMKEYPDFIEGYAFINPKNEDAVDEVEKCLGDYKMNGCKFHSWKQGYYPDNRPELDAIFETIQKYQKHVQMHVGTAPLSTPYIWAEWARKFPKVDFLFTHTGYYEFGFSTIEAIKDLPNVWVETSGQMDPEVLKQSVKVLGSERVAFGTDWPYKPVNIEIEKFQHLGFSDVALENIFFKNAEYLWRMK